APRLGCRGRADEEIPDGAPGAPDQDGQALLQEAAQRPDRKIQKHGRSRARAYQLGGVITAESMKNKLVVISAPSGAGKTTLCQRLLKDFKDELVLSI